MHSVTACRRWTFRLVCSVLVMSLVSARTIPVGATDLAKQYPATLNFSKQNQSYNWQTGPQDVWRLESFEYQLGDQFQIKLGPSQVVLGKNGSNVLWAAVYPDQPGDILKASGGQGDHITSIWIRFHPARVGELFSADTVGKQGDADLIKQARRLVNHKLRSSWHAGARPMVPSRESVVIDCETSERERRFYVIDTNKQTARYVDAFRQQTLSVPLPLEQGQAVRIFDQVWNAFDREYALFAVKEQIDWQQLKQEYQPRAANAKTNQDLAETLNAMLTELKDLHMYVRVSGRFLNGYQRKRLFNASPAAVVNLIEPLNQIKGLRWGRTQDQIGYIAVDTLSIPSLPDRFEAALKQMQGTRGLILDLRANGGGAEQLARKMAGYFAEESTLYAMHQYRSGPRHTDLGTLQKRIFAPDQNLYYRGPVIVLQGERTMSSAEAFVLMLAACPHVTTMGDRTAGSSGNPRQLDAGAEIIVNLPRWIPRDVSGKSFDTVGIQPDVPVKAAPEEFTRIADPVLTAALKRLRKQTSDFERTDAVLVPRSGNNGQQ